MAGLSPLSLRPGPEFMNTELGLQGPILLATLLDMSSRHQCLGPQAGFNRAGEVQGGELHGERQESKVG